jgi:hypothetical protein
MGSASGAPGTQTTFDVTLSTAGAMVAGVQADIAFDSNTPVAATGAGRPDCTVNPAINKQGTAFAFQPPGCSGTGCTAFRAIVFSLSNVEPIADGAVLYTCKVNIDPAAAPGPYPLLVSNVGMSTPDGQPIESVGTKRDRRPRRSVADADRDTAAGRSDEQGAVQERRWRSFTAPRQFKNQGDCIQFVNTGK